MEQTQNYANHPHRPTLWTVVLLLAVVSFVIEVLFVMRQLTVFTIGLLILSGAMIFGSAIWPALKRAYVGQRAMRQ